MTDSDLRVELKLYSGTNALRAFADVIVQTVAGELTLKGFRVFANKEGGFYAAVPETQYLHKGVQVKRKVVEGAPTTMRTILKAVIAAFEQEVIARTS